MHFFFEKKDNSNKELIEQIIMGKYDQYYRLAYSYVQNETDAYDIVQTGAYKAIKNSHTLKKPEYAQTWIYRIMLNECFQYLRQPKTCSYETMQERNELELRYTENNYEGIDLQRAIDSLSDKDKAIVILKYFEDKTLEEIAEILDENINTIKSRLYRSMGKLRKALSGDNSQSTYHTKMK